MSKKSTDTADQAAPERRNRLRVDTQVSDPDQEQFSNQSSLAALSAQSSSIQRQQFHGAAHLMNSNLDNPDMNITNAYDPDPRVDACYRELYRHNYPAIIPSELRELNDAHTRLSLKKWDEYLLSTSGSNLGDQTSEQQVSTTVCSQSSTSNVELQSANEPPSISGESSYRKPQMHKEFAVTTSLQQPRHQSAHSHVSLTGIY